LATLEKDVRAAHWGIEPVPASYRKFSAIDLAVLWGDLGIGLLVIITGALLVAAPEQFGLGLSLPAALASIVIGSLIGCLLLALGGLAGTREAVPTMVLLRPVLGTRGSWVPSILNVAQLLGWTAFELWAMALVGNRLGERLFGFSSFTFWLILFAATVLALSLWGPLGVVRVWMEKFGAWVLVAISAAITVYLLFNLDLPSLWSKPGAGGSFILGVPLDLVIAMPVSWLPLVADYNRFSSDQTGSFWGTFGGYLIANIWLYALGVLLILGLPQTAPSPEGIALGILSIGGLALTGALLLAGLLVGETDEAFADVYSAAVSLRNIFPKADGRMLVIAVTAIGTLLAGSLSMIAYELFLFLLGSVFVPLFGVWIADYYVLRNRGQPATAFRFDSLIPWILGFLVYHWIAPTPLPWWTEMTTNLFGSPLSVRFPWLSASIPSFLTAFGLHLAVGSSRRKTTEAS
jgi:putative hydroxymethylpyrimidine transporter CytX